MAAFFARRHLIKWATRRVPRIGCCRFITGCLLACGWLLFACLALRPAYATDAPSVLIIHKPGNHIHQAVIEAIRKEIAPTDVHLHTASIEQYRASIPRGMGADLVLAIGSLTTHEMLATTLDTSLLAVMIPREAYLAIRPSKGNMSSAIYIDQPYSRQLSLAKAIKPESKTLSVFIRKDGIDTEHTKNELTEAASGTGLNIRFHLFDDRDLSESNLYQSLDNAVAESDSLLALPDKHIYNSRTIRNILLSSYRNKVPVIGFSHAFIKAGAVAAVYSTPEEIGKQAGELIEKFFISDSRHLTAPQYPVYFSVSVNEQVAQSLGLNLPSVQDLEQRLHNDAK